MAERLGSAVTPRTSMTDSGAPEFMLRSEISALESRIVRHVEEVTSGSEATQNLLRRELQQEVERHGERHSVHLCKIEASCMELTCRLNDAEQRWSAAQQDTMAELTSLQGRLEAMNSKSLSDRINENEQRNQSSRQELFAEVAKLRAEFTARSEEAANERKLEFRSRTEQLEARIEELGRHAAETAGSLSRLGAIEQQLAAARAHPSTATLDAKISTITARVEAAEVQCKDLQHQTEAAAKEYMRTAAPAPAAASPGTALLLERLEARVEAAEQQLVAGNRSAQNASAGEIQELRTMISDTRSQMELMATGFATERLEYQTILAGVNKRQADEQASLAHVVGEMDAELRVELASRASDIASKLKSELKADVETRIGAAERDAIASVRESLGAGFQVALSELFTHVKKLQTAQTESVNLLPRIANIEHELRGTTRLVTSLANRALDDSQNLASMNTSLSGITSTQPTAEDRNTRVKSDMMGVIETAIRDAFQGPPGKHAAGKIRGSSVDVGGGATDSAEVNSEISTTHESHERPFSGHGGSEGSQATFAGDEHSLQYGQKDSSIPEGLLESLQGLANAIDKTIGSSTTRSVSPQQGRPSTGGLDTLGARAVSGPRDGGSVQIAIRPSGASVQVEGGSAQFAPRPTDGLGLTHGTLPDSELWNDGTVVRGRSVEQAKTLLCKAQPRPHTALGAPKSPNKNIAEKRSATPISGTTLPLDKTKSQQIPIFPQQPPALMQHRRGQASPGQTSPGPGHRSSNRESPLSARQPRISVGGTNTLEIPVNIARVDSSNLQANSVEVPSSTPRLNYRTVTPTSANLVTGARQGGSGTTTPNLTSNHYVTRLA